MKLKFTFQVFALLIFTTTTLWAQKQYNEQENFLMANRVWAFGRNAGLDFNSGKPVPIKTGAYSLEGTASACDPKTGALLFYVARGGEQVWNRNHQKMPNGDTVGGSNSTTQTCVVPVIDSPGLYYIFTLPIGGNTRNPGLRYSVVDMSLDNGLGDIRQGHKGIPLATDGLTFSESLIAIPGNNCDIWLMSHKLVQHEFIAFHITKDGIDPNYVLSSIPGPDTTYNYGIGGMYISPNRERLYITAQSKGLGPYKQCLLYKFDPNIGKVYDLVIMANPKMATPLGGNISAAFSPDNSKLYLTNANIIRQFDISIYDSWAIDTTMYLFGKGQGALSGDPFGLRLYGDTIYVGSGRPPSGRHLSTISHPYLKGAACGYDSASILLLAGTLSDYGMCAEIVYPMKGESTRSLVLDTLICADQFSLDLVADSGFNYYHWQDGVTGKQRQVTSPGTYWVSANMVGGAENQGHDCNNRVDTFIIRGGSFSPPIITVNVFELSTTMPYDTYQWYFNGVKIPGATKRKLNVTQNGNYTIEVTTKEGCISLSEIYKVTNVTDKTGTADYAGTGSYFSVYPNPTQDVLYINSSARLNASIFSAEGKLLRKSIHTNSISLKDLAVGMYILHLTDKEGRSLKKVKITKYD